MQVQGGEMKTEIKSKKKWQELILRWHDPQLQEGLGFMFDDMSLLERDMSLRHRIVASSIIKFVGELYSKAYLDNLYEHMHEEFEWELIDNHSHEEVMDFNLKSASFINEIKGKLPEEFYWKDDDRQLTLDRAKELMGFLEKAKDTGSEEYKILKISTNNDTIDEEILKKSGERDWENEYIKEFPYRFKKS